MPRRSDAPSTGRRRGYSLLAVLVVSVLIVVGATTLVLVTRQANLAGIADKRNATANAIAIAGLTWATTNLATPDGITALQTAAGGTDTDFNGTILHAFDGDEEWAGVGAAPPAEGASNASWRAFGQGHYALIAAPDPLDRGRSVLVRALGIMRDSRVLLETNLIINKLQTIPSGITGCFDDGVQITFYDQESPFDYSSVFRLDGGKGVPLALAIEHNRVNGLARCDSIAGDGSCSSPSVTAAGAEPQNRMWRGTQSLGSEPVAGGVANKFGGVHADNLLDLAVGPLTHWEANPFLTNDPRLVDTIASGGLGMNPGGWVWDGDKDTTSLERRGVPLIGTKGAPAVDFTDPDDYGVLRSDEWGGDEDDESRKGFYACDNHGASGDDVSSIEVCTKGSSGTSAADFTNNAVNHSGRAFGFVQMALRQCTGSGNSVDHTNGSPWYDPTDNPNGVICAQGFEYLENLAACLILPTSTNDKRGTNAVLESKWQAGGTYAGAGITGTGDGDDTNNFRGCHPGCLLAVDADGDGTLEADDRPFRSNCVNLDPENVSTYGPGVFSEKEESGGAASFSAVLTDGERPYGSSPGNTAWAALGDDAWQEYNYPGQGNPTESPGSNFGDDGEAPRFKDAAGNWVGRGGAVGEYGNLHFITRLDMSDRGPLGTCEQNCLAYGFGKDGTYGAHRTDVANPGGVAATTTDSQCSAIVPKHSTTHNETATVVCNVDYDQDGLLDRKSFALHSAYREKCTDDHDGIAQSPAFNISSANGNLAGAGCVNNMPNFDAATTPQTLSPFCDDGSSAELDEAIAYLDSIAVEITSNELNKTDNPVKEGIGWFGDAQCHMGALTFSDPTGSTIRYNPHASGHTGALSGIPVNDTDALGNPDYWIEEGCPNPGVWRIDTNANINLGYVCGCGILILPANSLQFDDSHFLWRGLIIWDLKNTGGELLKMDKSSASDTWVIQGGMVMYGSNDFRVKITKKADDATVVAAAEGSLKQMYVYDPAAISEAFSGLRPPVRTVRRVH